MDLKKYLTLSAKAYGAIQFSGIILGAFTLWLSFGRTVLTMLYGFPETIGYTLLNFLVWMLVAQFLGFLITTVPTIIFSLLLPALVIYMEKKFSNSKLIYLATSILIVAIFQAPLVDALDPEMYWPMLLSSILAGLVGTRTVLKKMHAPRLESIVTPLDEVEAQSTQAQP